MSKPCVPTKLQFDLNFRVVPVKEPSIIIAASSEHRKEAIDAVAFAIDAVKSSTTVWKKVRIWVCGTCRHNSSAVVTFGRRCMLKVLESGRRIKNAHGSPTSDYEVTMHQIGLHCIKLLCANFLSASLAFYVLFSTCM